jgi:hypothetical protein
MDRAFSSGASGTPPTAPVSPSVGYATSGNPATATPATKPGPWWYHMMTEELRKVITDAGLTPDQTNLSQLSQAIQLLIAAGTANDYKASVRVATTAAITTLAGGAPNTLDGITLVLGDRILVKDQGTGSQNGLYSVTTLGTGINGTWTRTTDADGAGELTSGAVVSVEEGATNADSQWQLTTDGAITLGTTALVFTKVGGSSFASNAEAQALSVTNKVISPATLAQAFKGGNQSLSTSGYQKLPGGLIIQWGQAPFMPSTITFPIAFPTVCYAILAGSNSGSAGSLVYTGFPPFSLTGFTGSPTNVACQASWLAIGN